ncbi:hypothetical protein MJO28_010906 [Puccinia striiformis f. sp. tritici]|uniref:Uncharacterized protein n=1 Tax=Puccinia striiformis f. sp. tritici TaxID=168172 RepID=A0ACC0E751_9BASI|nr:hypothetical protein MJO28_010906 [Puccinia striiformis f. sp. tritici]
MTVGRDNPAMTAIFNEMTGPEKAGAMISVICGLCRKVKQLSNTIKATPQIRPTEAAVISSLSHAEQVRTFTFTGEFKEFLRQSARENLLDYTVEAYGNDDNERSLYRAVLSALLQQTPQYKRLQLPPNSEMDPLLVSPEGLRPMSSQTSASSPDWSGDTSWAPKTGLQDEEIDEAITPLLKVHIAFLRLATIANFLDLDMRNVSQWDQIDARLAQMRLHPILYTKHWHRLLSLRDELLFSHSPLFAEVDHPLLKCPTHAVVNARMVERNERV